MPDSLCTFTPNLGSPVSLGSHDCFVVATPGEDRTTYTVTCFYVDASGDPILVSGAQRQEAEVYLRDLAVDLGLTQLYERIGPTGRVLIPRAGAVYGTLVNPYTGLNVPKCYCTDLQQEDNGQRAIGFTATFVQPKFDITTAPFNVSDILWGATQIGDVGGRWEIAVSNSFVRYKVSAQYRGANIPTYLGTLAATLGFDPIFTTDLARGTAGNRGAIRSPLMSPQTLTWTSKTASQTNAYLESLEGSENDPGLLDINAVFVAKR